MAEGWGDVEVLIPVLNEEKTVSKVILDFVLNLPDCRVIVVDNGSDDATKEIVMGLSELNSNIVLLNEPSPGKGRAVRRGLHFSRADWVVIVDGDGTYCAKDALALTQMAKDAGYDMVVGERFTSGDYSNLSNRRPFHDLGNRVVSTLVSVASANRLNDVMSGLRVVSRRLAATYPCRVEGFQLETDLALFCGSEDLSVTEASISYYERPEGSTSKLRTLRDGARILLRVNEFVMITRPFLYFLPASVLLTIVTLIIGNTVVIDFLDDGLVQGIPRVILATGTGLLASFMFLVAVVLGSLRRLQSFSTR